MTAPSTATPFGFSPLVYGCSKLLVLAWARVWLRLSLQGCDRAPASGPLLAVGNHCSYLDPPLLGVAMPRPVQFLAQKGLAKFPPLRWWLRAAGVSLIDRSAPSKDVLRFLANALEAGACVSIFPEGTRSQDGLVGPFRSGVEFLVRRTGAPVLPIGIDGTFRALPRGGKFPRPAKCVVRCGEVWPQERVLAPGGIEALRREIATLANAGLRTDDVQSPRVDQGRSPAPADPAPSPSPSRPSPNPTSGGGRA